MIRTLPGVAILLLLVLAAAPLPAAPGATAPPADPLLEQAILRALGEPTGPLKYVSAKADLNGDGRPETLAWAPNPRFGGTGGYPFMIFSREGPGYRLLWKYGLAWTPAIVLKSSSHGWHDIVLQVGGGGERMRYALFRHNGRSYSRRFKIISAKRAHGRVLLDKIGR